MSKENPTRGRVLVCKKTQRGFRELSLESRGNEPDAEISAHLLSCDDCLSVLAETTEKEIEFDKTLLEQCPPLPYLSSLRAAAQPTASRQSRRECWPELWGNAEKFLWLIEQNSNAILVHDGRKILYANIAAAELLGETQESILGKSVCLYDLPDVREGAKSLLVRSQDGRGLNQRVETQLTKKDGSLVEVEGEARPTLYRDGVATILEVRDLTEQRMAERKAAEDQKRIAQHFDMAPFGVIEWDENYRVRRWSKQAEVMFGWTEAEAKGKHPNEWGFTAIEDKEQVNRVIQDLLAGKTDANGSVNRNCTKDGRMLHCEWNNSVLKDETGKVISILSFVRDVTERVEARRELQRREEIYRHFAETSHDAISLLSPEGIMLYINPAAATMLGYEQKDLLNRSFKSFVFKESAQLIEERINRVLAGEPNSEDYELILRHRDGHLIHAQVLTSVVREEGRAVGFYSVYREITHNTTQRVEEIQPGEKHLGLDFGGLLDKPEAIELAQIFFKEGQAERAVEILNRISH